MEGVGCPGWECTKDRALPDAEDKEKDAERGNETHGEKKREIDVDFVRGVVGDELATRYVWLLEKKRVETGTSRHSKVRENGADTCVRSDVYRVPVTTLSGARPAALDTYAEHHQKSRKGLPSFLESR